MFVPDPEGPNPVKVGEAKDGHSGRLHRSQALRALFPAEFPFFDTVHIINFRPNILISIIPISLKNITGNALFDMVMSNINVR